MADNIVAPDGRPSAKILAFPGCPLQQPEPIAPALSPAELEELHVDREVHAAIDLFLLLASRKKRTGAAPDGDPFALAGGRAPGDVDRRSSMLRVAANNPARYRDHLLRCIAEEAARLDRYKAPAGKRQRKEG